MKAQTLYFQELLLNTKNSVKKLWQTFGPIINPKKNKSKGNKITQINFNNEIISDKLSMANCFNNYFCSIGHKLASQLNNSNNNFKQYLPDGNIHSIFLKPADEHEIEKIIDAFDNKKAVGINDIPVKIMKACKHQLAKPLTQLVNISFSSGVFPDQLKIARVIPLFKKDNPDLLANYTPIGIITLVSKILEKLII